MKLYSSPLVIITILKYSFPRLGITINEADQNVKAFSGVSSCVITLIVNGDTNESYTYDSK